MSLFLFFFARYVERVTRLGGGARSCSWSGSVWARMLYPYGVIFVGHALAAALAFSGFMLLSAEPASDERHEPRRAAASWAGVLVASVGDLRISGDLRGG